MAWFWRILQPTFTLITYTILFEQIGGVDFGKGIPYFFVMSAAMLPWTVISQVMLGAVTSIAANAGFFGKVYFPAHHPADGQRDQCHRRLRGDVAAAAGAAALHGHADQLQSADGPVLRGSGRCCSGWASACGSRR